MCSNLLIFRGPNFEGPHAPRSFRRTIHEQFARCRKAPRSARLHYIQGFLHVDNLHVAVVSVRYKRRTNVKHPGNLASRHCARTSLQAGFRRWKRNYHGEQTVYVLLDEIIAVHGVLRHSTFEKLTNPVTSRGAGRHGSATGQQPRTQ